MFALLYAAPSVSNAEFSQFLVLDRVGSGGRSIIQRDAVLKRLADGWSDMPKEGEAIKWGEATVTWRAAQADGEGWLKDRSMSGGWAATEIDWDGQAPYLLKCAGASQLWVNGLPYAGDVYSTGTLILPLRLHRGKNVLLFKGGRGQIRAERVPSSSPGLNFGLETTLPDYTADPKQKLWASASVFNASSSPRAYPRRTATEIETQRIAPYGVARIPFLFPDSPVVTLAMEGQPKMFTLERKKPTEVHKRTFVSAIDGSVQYFGVNPAVKPEPGQALILSPHGASVEAIGQAGAYGQKTWGTLVAPTNRRPYGFDWEDWGRLDALEVLAEGKRLYQPDESKIYLTGHSMGGHGTWILGNQFADQFAAIGPAAGWINFWSYGGAIQIENPDAVEAMLLRAAQVSDPLLTVNNYKPLCVYTVHGDADDTVPVSQAREMQEKLKGIATSLDGHEQPGGGHWYDSSDDPGSDCVDYPPMFDFFLRHRRKPNAEVRQVDFATCSPGVTARSHWAEIVMQTVIGDPSRVQLDLSPSLRRVTGTTANVRTLRLNLAHLGPGRAQFQLDGSQMEAMLPESGIVTLVRDGEIWHIRDWSPSKKNPDRYGWFKSAFNHRFMLIYGTTGTDEEDRQNLARANFDSQTWFYRGNGDCDVVSDVEFAGMKHQGRSLILYGNRTTNAAWDGLVKNPDFAVERGMVRLGERSWRGKDLGALVCLPKPGEQRTMVGIVAYTGGAGAALTASWPYFLAGVHVPDVMIARSSMLTEGSKGVVAAGFWNEDWGWDGAQMAVR